MQSVRNGRPQIRRSPGASARCWRQIAAGASNKEAGRHLGISPRTIEVHRARIMEKLGAKNAADLVRIVMRQRPPALMLGRAAQNRASPGLTALARRGIDRGDGVSPDFQRKANGSAQPRRWRSRRWAASR